MAIVARALNILRTCAHGHLASNLVYLAIMQALAGLPALTRLYLKSDIKRGSLVPSCEELACLRSTSLRDLTVHIDQVMDHETVYTQCQDQGDGVAMRVQIQICFASVTCCCCIQRRPQ